MKTVPHADRTKDNSEDIVFRGLRKTAFMVVQFEANNSPSATFGSLAGFLPQQTLCD